MKQQKCWWIVESYCEETDAWYVLSDPQDGAYLCWTRAEARAMARYYREEQPHAWLGKPRVTKLVRA